MQRNIFIVCNPASGNKKGSKVTRSLADFLTQQQIDFEIGETSPGLSADKLVAGKLSNTVTDLIVIGGDGTVNQAVNGLKYDLPVGIIPTGSGNDYVKNLAIGKKTSDHIQTAVHGTEQRVDLGLVNNRKFLNGIGIGFDGQIVHEMAERAVPFLSGQAKYYYHVLHILSSYRQRTFDFSVDGEALTKDLILMTIAKGTTFGGGFKLTPHAQLTDGRLAVCEVGPLPAWKRYANILRLQNGSHDKLKEVTLYHADRVKIEANPLLSGHIDGEDLGKPPFDVSVIRGGLRIRENRFDKP